MVPRPSVPNETTFLSSTVDAFVSNALNIPSYRTPSLIQLYFAYVLHRHIIFVLCLLIVVGFCFYRFLFDAFMYDSRLCSYQEALVQGLLGFPSIELEKCVAGRVTIITEEEKEKEG